MLAYLVAGGKSVSCVDSCNPKVFLKIRICTETVGVKQWKQCFIIAMLVLLLGSPQLYLNGATIIRCSPDIAPHVRKDNIT